MNRSQALAPLAQTEDRFQVSAGLVIRGEVRRASVRCGIDFYEEKGWFESLFVFRGERRAVLAFKQLLEAALD